MQINLKGKRALIAGGSRGIGLGIAQCFAKAGADVSICARTQSSLDEAQKTLSQYGGRVIATACDLGDANAIQAWVKHSAAELGGIDTLVNNASAFGRQDNEEDWAASVQIDLMAAVRASAAAMPFLEKQGGNIIHISSISGLKATVRSVPYGAIKAAMMEYTQTQALSYAKKNIRVNCIAPGSVFFEGGNWDKVKRDNPKLYEATLAKIPFGRYGKPEEIGQVVAFLVSDLGSWVTGQTIVVDGGQTL
jgi:3-oxoacyl-[acyl-carrier protein] reductase